MGYNLEIEINNTKSRVGAYVRHEIKYKRRIELEGQNSHIVIIDVTKKTKTLRIINIYRSFNPHGGVSATEMFNYQLDLINLAFNTNTLLVGDINLDFSKRNISNYHNKNLFESFDLKLGRLDLIQLVKFPTWSRMIGNTLKSSILDHIYVKDPTIISNINSLVPTFGDHLLITFNIPLQKAKIDMLYKRDWRKYDKNVVNEL